MAKADQGVMAFWVAAHHFGKALKYIGFNGSGKQVRDFLHIADFGDLLLDQLAYMELYGGKRWNVGGGAANSLSLLETTELCREIGGRSVPVTPTAESRPADLRIYITDHRRVSAVNGWAPRRDARRTLTDIFEWVRAEEVQLRQVLFP
jgi:CDP-paratose 2-epimerase